MARTGRAFHMIERNRDYGADVLAECVARLREDVRELASALRDQGAHRYGDLQHNASALVHDLRRQLPVATEELGRQARLAGRAVQRDPVPLLVTVGTIALLSSLFRRSRR